MSNCIPAPLTHPSPPVFTVRGTTPFDKQARSTSTLVHVSLPTLERQPISGFVLHLVIISSLCAPMQNTASERSPPYRVSLYSGGYASVYTSSTRASSRGEADGNGY